MNYLSASFFFTAMLIVVTAQWENNVCLLKLTMLHTSDCSFSNDSVYICRQPYDFFNYIILTDYDVQLHVLRIDKHPCEIDDSFREFVEGSGIYVKADAYSSPHVADEILESQEISDIFLKGFIRKEHTDTALFRLSISNKHRVRIPALAMTISILS